MTRGKIRVLGHRRRREGRTDYRHRLGLLKSGKPRLVVRRSVNSMTCQIVKHSPSGDESVVTVSGKHLEGFGWKASKGNVPGAYLTGLLCGVHAKKKGIRTAVLDTGLHTSTRGSRIYGALKGALDAGLDIPHSPEVLPSEERISGKHIDDYMESSGRKAGVAGMFDQARVRILKAEPGKSAAKKASGKEAGKAAAKRAQAKRAQVKKPSTKKPAVKKAAKK